MENKTFRVGDQPVNGTPWHYRSCGLDDVYLLNGFTVETTAENEPIVTINDIDGLHHAIGQSIAMQTRPMRPRELRFLRKAMAMTQAELATLLGVDCQTVARYEKEQSGIPGSIDIVMRVKFTIYKLPTNVQIDELKKVVALLEKTLTTVRNVESHKPDSQRRFQRTDGRWDGRVFAT